MSYGLAPYPLDLFEAGQIRKTNKSTFYELFLEASVTIHDVQDFVTKMMEVCYYIYINSN